MSFETEVIAWLPQLRRYARALTGDRAWADDLVQDTAERALARWAAFRPNSNLRAWLLTILRNIYIDQLRGRREIAVDESSAPWRNLEAPQGEVDGLVLRDLQRALYRLPLEQREVLLLVCVEELSYQEASRALGVPIGTVMSRLSRAREQLRVLLTQGPVPGQEPARKTAPLKVVRNP
ncbi:sigma-70 family RNA polymerase sigma factor [Paraburkholderia sp. BCC1884]|uniref:sigma-70 family RNA polymerase sigma factor n=1 Tax=Paraburkholderia sp. BCC1884 TaxID=2562668 RepID=UPI001184258E|nr:sigma-70 family RNA polymerase sigma factor [Paraburkholderia sp. BCC1884]